MIQNSAHDSKTTVFIVYAWDTWEVREDGGAGRVSLVTGKPSKGREWGMKGCRPPRLVLSPRRHARLQKDQLMQIALISNHSIRN